MTREEMNQEKQQEIFSEERHEKRKKITILIFKLCGIIVLGFILFYLYTNFVSSKIITVNEHRIINDKIPDSFSGLKVIQFSDLHYGTTFFAEDLAKVVSEINKRKPDLVVFTGDLIDEKYELKTEEQEKIIKQLKKINSSLGNYAVFGDDDDEIFQTIMKESNFEILDNSYELIYKDSNNPILLVGIDSLLNDKDNLENAFSYFNETAYNSNIFSLVIMHEPDMVDSIINEYPSDLLLAGHSHNGSIVIPFVGGLYRVDGARNYYKSYYKIDDNDFYISSGLGTDGPGFRLFCRPSINFFRISNK